MIYTEHLPTVDSITYLAEVAGSFPATRQDISRIARSHGFGPDTLSFLELFPAGVRFENKGDFISRCEELELLIQDEREMPAEGPLSPQD